VAQAHASISANDEDEVESENGESSHIEARKRIANEETQSAKRNISELRRLWRRLRWTPTTTTTTALGSRERFQIFLALGDDLLQKNMHIKTHDEDVFKSAE
jgi:hypothetical protein